MNRNLKNLLFGKRLIILVGVLLTMVAAPVAILTLNQYRDASAQEVDLFDLVTDDDSNGIPDEFEDGFNNLADAVNQTDDPAQVIQEFVDRVPMSSATKEYQEQMKEALEGVEHLTSPSEQKAAIVNIKNLRQQMLDGDAQLVSTLAYFDILKADYDNEFTPPLRSSTGRKSTRHTSGSGALRDVSEDDIEEQEDEINRPGDIMFVYYDHINPSWLWAMDWSHVGLYAGDGQVYESDVGFGCGGADLRNISKFIRDGYEIQYAQLDEEDGRSHVDEALDWAQDTYGTGCDTGYNWAFPNKWTDSSLYCSQLVWKTYKNIEDDYDVDLDSNHWIYLGWIALHYGNAHIAALAIPAVAPDEIARDGDLDYYYRTTLDFD